MERYATLPKPVVFECSTENIIKWISSRKLSQETTRESICRKHSVPWCMVCNEPFRYCIHNGGGRNNATECYTCLRLMEMVRVEVKWVNGCPDPLYLCYRPTRTEFPPTAVVHQDVDGGVLNKVRAVVDQNFMLCEMHTFPWCMICNIPFCYCPHNDDPHPSQCSLTLHLMDVLKRRQLQNLNDVYEHLTV